MLLVPASQVGVNSRPRPKTPASATTDDHVLLFRVCKYGNNKHKKKFSTAVGPCSLASMQWTLTLILVSLSL